MKLSDMEKTPNSLVKAIGHNSYDDVHSFLQQGCKLTTDDLIKAFIYPTEDYIHPDDGRIMSEYINLDLDPEIVNLLFASNALPEGITPATLKLILLTAGHTRFDLNTIINSPDLNVNGCDGLPTPMHFATRRATPDLVELLIAKGATDRPMELLFSDVQFEYLQGIDPHNMKRYTDRLVNIYLGLDFPLPPDMTRRFHIALMFIFHPTASLKEEVTKDIATLPAHNIHMLPVFAALAMSNETTIFANAFFRELFSGYRREAAESILIATSFSANEFVLTALEFFAEDKPLLRSVLSIAAALGNESLVQKLVTEANITLKDVHPAKIDSCAISMATYELVHHFGNTVVDEGPLYWAIRNQKTNLVDYLLTQGMDANDYTSINGSGYLKTAVDFANKKIVELLLQHGAKVNASDQLKNTPLHAACRTQNWEMIELLVNHGASLAAFNCFNETPFDYVKDESLRERIRQLCEAQKATDKQSYKITLGFLNHDPKHLIDITDLDKATVLLSLYNTAAKPDDYNHGDISKAQSLIAMNPEMKFDFVDLGAGPRAIKVDLSQNHISKSTYDVYNGKGKCQEAIALAKEAQRENLGIEGIELLRLIKLIS